MRRVVIATPLTEGLAATPHAAGRTNSRSAVTAHSHSPIATGRPYVAVACSVFDLAIDAHLRRFSRSPFRSRIPFGLHFSAPFLGVSIMHLFHFLCDIWMRRDDFVIACTISSHDPADNF
jgi:hypothetical protein